MHQKKEEILRLWAQLTQLTREYVADTALCYVGCIPRTGLPILSQVSRDSDISTPFDACGSVCATPSGEVRISSSNGQVRVIRIGEQAEVDNCHYYACDARTIAMLWIAKNRKTPGALINELGSSKH